MCRSDIATEARGLLGGLLGDMARALAAQSGIDPAGVVIGPVDFGGIPAAQQPRGATHVPGVGSTDPAGAQRRSKGES